MKTLHVLAVVLFLGKIITGLFSKVHGDRTADLRILAHSLDGMIRSDRWFTIPGVVFILAFGAAAAVIGGPPILRTGWIWQSTALFAVSGLAFMQVAPPQRRLHALASAGAGGGPWDEVAYRRLSPRWELWGIVALVRPLAALVLMVYKPGA